MLSEASLPQAAEIWRSGWHEAHAAIVPRQLAQLRTPESFGLRLRAHLQGCRVALHGDRVLGLCIVKDDELYQMYVAPEARGTGIAQALMRDAEARILAAGHRSAWLGCAIGNTRAARFYEGAGWTNAGQHEVALDTLDGVFPLDCWVFRKALGAKG